MKPELKLTGKDGNAFAILGNARRAAVKAKWDKTEIDKVLQEAMSGDYNHLLRTIMKHFDVR